MTHTERKDLAGSYEKPWHRSKKFVAFLLMEIMFCAMAIIALFTQKNLGWPLAAFMTGIVIVMGFIALSFNGKQAELDMYVRAMALTGAVPGKLKTKLKLDASQIADAVIEPDPDLEEEII